jgi:hypothetical protein
MGSYIYAGVYRYVKRYKKFKGYIKERLPKLLLKTRVTLINIKYWLSNMLAQQEKYTQIKSPSLQEGYRLYI